MQNKLTGIPETLLIPLWARAYETERDESIIKDYPAVNMVVAINYGFEKFRKAWLSQIGVSVRHYCWTTPYIVFCGDTPERSSSIWARDWTPGANGCATTTAVAGTIWTYRKSSNSAERFFRKMKDGNFFRIPCSTPRGRMKWIIAANQ